MNDIIGYVEEYGKYTFDEREFTTEDALVLSELAYMKFDGIVGGMNEKPVALQDIDKLDNTDALFPANSNEKDFGAFYRAIVDSPRFGNMKLCCYINQIGAEFQFSSVTYIFPGGITFVAFRGTDETMVGWQEDFSMALKHPVKGQLLSAQYVNEISDAISGNFYVGGHSKGGNLAMYAAMSACDEARDRIIGIYSFDGPGFRPENIKSEAYEEIEDRVVKVIPKSSPIGLVFNNSDVTVVEARAIGAMQHNPFSWVIKDGRLVETKLTEQHMLTARAMNEWLLSLDDENLELFVSALCWTLDATNATTTTQVKGDVTKYLTTLYKAGIEVDEEQKERAKALLKSFFSLAGDLVLQEAKEKYNSILSEITKAKDDLLERVREERRDAKNTPKDEKPE